MLTFDCDGTRKECDSLLMALRAFVVMGANNQFALGCFTSPTGCQSSSAASLPGSVCAVYFTPMWSRCNSGGACLQEDETPAVSKPQCSYMEFLSGTLNRDEIKLSPAAPLMLRTSDDNAAVI